MDKELREAMKRHPAGKKKKLVLTSIVTYNCCDHCGINFMMDSACETHPNAHTVPCNEPGCRVGIQIAHF